MKKNNSGFSLVELIVVIAIMAILAGIAVPTYVKYIAEAKNAKYINTLDEIKTAAIAAGIKDKKAEVTEIRVAVDADGKATTIQITTDAATDPTITINSSTAKTSTFLYLMDVETGVGDIQIAESGTTYATGATWTASAGEWAIGATIP